MSSVACETLLYRYPSNSIPKLITGVGETKRFSFNYSSSSKIGGSIRCSGPARILCVAARAGGPSAVSDNDDVVYRRTFRLKRTKIVEGEIYIKLDPGVKEGHWQLIVGCNLPGKWILRWGVHFVGDPGSEWDQPPRRMRPQGSVAVKDYAVDTPMRDVTLTEEGDRFQQVKIDINTSDSIASISFILRDEETGLRFQNVGRDFKVPLADYFQEDAEQSGESLESCKPLDRFHEEQHVLKTITLENSVHVSVSKCGETANNLVHIETDLLEDVIVHWGVCKDDQKKWELPPLPHPPDTKIYKNRALHTKLQPIEDGTGNTGLFTLDKDLAGLIFVLRLGDGTWLQYMKNDFFIPLQSACRTSDEVQDGESREKGVNTPSIDNESEESSCEKLQDTLKQSNSSDVPKTSEEEEEEEKQESSPTTFTNGLIKNIRDLVRNISSEKKWIRKSKNTQESLLTEIEKLAAQAYSIFRSNIPSLSKQKRKDFKAELPTVRLHPATGTGYEILCQGFNWESHKSGKWYIELHEKADYLSSLGFTIIWLPPPTESVSPEGYMPKDLYNLNSRYGTIDQLKAVISKFHEVDIKVLGDVVLNHRCASYQNHNGVWNIFGGRLNWDDRAVVGDDPHFQGRGNKSSGDNFHAAPNIDHSQDFVRRDIKEWMRWLKNEVGYDGWRLDFVRGFWGGYVKDYLEATEPYFSVGEYWDSLSYTYSEMDYDQNAHRQRIIDWIKNTDGYSGAFDVTTKGILHSAVGNCQYWRLRDPDGKPPGVVGWWPSRAVTFIENHDTGSTQGHWRFPTGKEMQGYIYILTHPGTPSIFYDHFYSSLHAEICKLVAVRRRNKLHCRSDVQIVKAENDLYAAIIDDKVAMKIGPGHYEPSSDRKWSLAIQGDQYKVWETL